MNDTLLGCSCEKYQTDEDVIKTLQKAMKTEGFSVSPPAAWEQVKDALDRRSASLKKLVGVRVSTGIPKSLGSFVMDRNADMEAKYGELSPAGVKDDTPEFRVFRNALTGFLVTDSMIERGEGIEGQLIEIVKASDEEMATWLSEWEASLIDGVDPKDYPGESEFAKWIRTHLSTRAVADQGTDAT